MNRETGPQAEESRAKVTLLGVGVLRLVVLKGLRWTESKDEEIEPLEPGQCDFLFPLAEFGMTFTCVVGLLRSPLYYQRMYQDCQSVRFHNRVCQNFHKIFILRRRELQTYLCQPSSPTLYSRELDIAPPVLREKAK